MVVNSRRAEHIADTRAALVQAARELFAERGYQGTGTEDIVARARVTRGALYHHFRDKADLFRVVVQTVASELAQRLVAEELGHAPGGAGGAWGQLREGVQAFLANWGITPKKIRAHNGTWCAQWNHRDSLTLAEVIYSEPGPCLARKRDVFARSATI